MLRFRVKTSEIFHLDFCSKSELKSCCKSLVQIKEHIQWLYMLFLSTKSNKIGSRIVSSVFSEKTNVKYRKYKLKNTF